MADHVGVDALGHDDVEPHPGKGERFGNRDDVHGSAHSDGMSRNPLRTELAEEATFMTKRENLRFEPAISERGRKQGKLLLGATDCERGNDEKNAHVRPRVR
jgi:hypothetical protein